VNENPAAAVKAGSQSNKADHCAMLFSRAQLVLLSLLAFIAILQTCVICDDCNAELYAVSVVNIFGVSRGKRCS